MDKRDLTTWGIHIHYGDTGTALYLWQPPLFICRKENESVATACFIKRLTTVIGDAQGTNALCKTR